MDPSPADDRTSVVRAETDGGSAPTMVVVGDSVAWGQGLRHEQKFATRFYEDLVGGSDSLSPAAIKAHSGAVVGTDSSANRGDVTMKLADSREGLAGTIRQGRHEYPYPYFDVPAQVERLPEDYTAAERPDGLAPRRAFEPHTTVDVALVTAGINDIDATSVVNPFSGPEAMESAVRESCYVRMKRLLEQLVERFPDAIVVVTGYHLFLSTGPQGSDIQAIDRLSAGLQTLFGMYDTSTGAVIQTLFGAADISEELAASNVEYFYQQSTHYLRKAVTETDNRYPGRAILFASPDFERANAANAADPWVWPVASTGDSAVDAERRKVCQRLDGLVSVKCPIAPSLHPNPAGAKAIARAVRHRYSETNGKQSIRELLENLGGENDRSSGIGLRDTLERYEGVDGLLDPEAGLRSCLDQTVVDSIRVKIRTSDGRNAGNQAASVSLDLGDFSRELDDEIWQRVFEHANFSTGAVDDFAFDPLFGSDRTERDPLRLWDIGTPTLEQDQPDAFEFVNSQSWKIASFELFLNGVTVVETGPFTLDGDDQQRFDYPTSA